MSFAHDNKRILTILAACLFVFLGALVLALQAPHSRLLLELYAAKILNMPSFITFGIVGGIVGGLVGGVGYLLKLNRRFVGVAGALAVGIATQAIPPLRAEVSPVYVVEQMKESRLFAVIFRLHPEEEANLIDKLRENYNSPAKMRDVFSGLVGKYINPEVMFQASDHAVYNLLTHQFAVLKLLQRNAHSCVQYYFAGQMDSTNGIPAVLIYEEMDLKADIIESANSASRTKFTPPDLNAFGNGFAAEYRRKGFNIGELAKLEEINSLSDVELCQIVVELSDVFASLDQANSVNMFKSFTYYYSR